MNSDKINALLIFEILGKPPEHIVEALKEILQKIGNEPGIEIKSEKVHEPTKVKGQEDIFTTFAEVEVEVEEVFKMMVILFRYMPAHIEIVYPEKLDVESNKLNEVLNETARRLHSYDEVARILQTEKIILEKRLKDIEGKEAKEG